MVSENRTDVTCASDCVPSIEGARYWFEQYRYASDWEARLIRAIRELSADHDPPQQELE